MGVRESLEEIGQGDAHGEEGRREGEEERGTVTATQKRCRVLEGRGAEGMEELGEGGGGIQGGGGGPYRQKGSYLRVRIRFCAQGMEEEGQGGEGTAMGGPGKGGNEEA